MSESAASEVDESGARRPIWRRLLTGPRIIIGAVVAAFIGFAVPLFSPGLVDRFMSGSPVRYDSAFDPFGETAVVWAFPESLQGIKPPAIHPNEGMLKWFVDRGGVQVGESAVKVVIEGRRVSKVTITGLRAHVLQRQPPLRGTLFYLPAQGAYDNSKVGVDLDAPVPSARRMEDGELRAPFFADQTVEIGRDESHTFEILARTVRCLCTWEVKLDLLIDDRQQTVTLRDRQNQPFRTTAWSSSYEAAFVWGQMVPTSENVSDFVPTDPMEACKIASCGSMPPT
jgi:hypothetical protein